LRNDSLGQPPLTLPVSRTLPYKKNFSRRTQAGRVAWGVVWAILFRPSPRPFFVWRSLLLQLFGARIGKGCHVYPSTRIWAPWKLTMEDGSTMADFVDCYCVDRITLGVNSTVSIRTFLCSASHDIRDPARPLTTSPIMIGQDAFIFAEAFIGPGVTIGESAVVGARAVVVRDVAAGMIVAGNPAKPIGERTFKTPIRPSV
jgi:putative colanic acid biosynthesis acetyltransferase WcaF